MNSGCPNVKNLGGQSKKSGRLRMRCSPLDCTTATMAMTSRWLPRITCMGGGNRQLVLFLFPSSLPSCLCLSVSLCLSTFPFRGRNQRMRSSSASLCKAARSGQPWAALLSFFPCRPPLLAAGPGRGHVPAGSAVAVCSRAGLTSRPAVHH